ncbi:MAG: thioredoxin domain-containing protein [Halonotius sp. J07HN4]|jgi:Thioredoxin domain-containing protein|nr:MAG: thioredoxin domain-containing protein [Halonotius sp. J07HN4]
MSDADPIEEIREQKRQELMDELRDGGDSGTADATGDTAVTDTDAPETPIHIDGTEHFNDLTARHDVVLVDFYADWCGPCQQLEPIVEEVAATTDAAVAKVDIDRHQQLAQQHGVQGVPTMVIFSGGRPEERLVGVKSAAQLTSAIESIQ